MKRVLVVDDEKSIRISLRDLLMTDGYTVEVAANAQDALRLLGDHDFDVILSDIVLPGISGIELLQAIRTAAPLTQVIMMTGAPTVATAAEAVRAGACDYLAKPIGKNAILRSVATAVQIKQIQDEKRHLQEQNQKYQDDLEKMVIERTRALQDANQKLEAALVEIQRSQEKIIKQERLSALGQMVSGITHDFNNTLMPILGFSDLLISNAAILDDRKETLRMIGLIHLAGNDARQIVRRLKTIYKRDEGALYEMVDLAKIIESAISLTMGKWKEEMSVKGVAINIVADFQPVPQIKGDASELREVLTNLILNATDAMVEDGRITFQLCLENNNSIVLKVSDTGAGMVADTLRHCIEPFFTTKGLQGTGLGLPMVVGIIERHGGTVEIISNPGAGTTIIMRFPVQNNTAGAAERPDRELKQIVPLRILVIDDEKRSRDILIALLKYGGHQVMEAAGPLEGLELFRHGEFDLIITDRAMPLMNGDEFVKQAHKIKPGIPVIMVTGFGDIMKEKGEIPVGVALVLTKPITNEELTRGMAYVMRENTRASQGPT